MSRVLDAMSQEERNIFLQNVRNEMRRPQVQKIVLFMLDTCGIYRSSISLNGEVSGVMEGERNVGLQLIDLLDESDPQIYPLLLLAEVQEKLSRPKPKAPPDEV